MAKIKKHSLLTLVFVAQNDVLLNVQLEKYSACIRQFITDQMDCKKQTEYQYTGVYHKTVPL